MVIAAQRVRGALLEGLVVVAEALVVEVEAPVERERAEHGEGPQWDTGRWSSGRRGRTLGGSRCRRSSGGHGGGRRWWSGGGHGGSLGRGLRPTRALINPTGQEREFGAPGLPHRAALMRIASRALIQEARVGRAWCHQRQHRAQVGLGLRVRDIAGGPREAIGRVAARASPEELLVKAGNEAQRIRGGLRCRHGLRA
ncbi:hypothetical protein MFU01_70200 [Myxococcus fulvus]|uniref:Uncharacterized protein n=1 Tax=Myxococcus fulvus TaxID=33 RepID=A0A511TEA2_MYXFU|nr:hypothetical protein MFU01_70200 [Myxococcus fulvus]